MQWHLAVHRPPVRYDLLIASFRGTLAPRGAPLTHPHYWDTPLMGHLYDFARRMQFLADLAPAPWRVPLRFKVHKALRSLEPEIRFLPALVPPRGIAVDAGASRGTYTVILSQLCKHVIAFEPLPECARELRAWASHRNVTVHECALTSDEGTTSLYIPRIAGERVFTRASLVHRDGPHECINVRTTALDAFALDCVGFLKIDIEGAELAMLNGAATTIDRWRPNILIEINPRRSGRIAGHQVFAWLAARGYTPHCMSGTSLRVCGPSIWDTKPDAYNFVFTPTRSTALPVDP